MTQLSGIAPQFLVADLDAALAYYCNRLGFAKVIGYEEFYASVAKDQAEIHLKRCPPLAAERSYRREGDHIDAFITVTDLDTYLAQCRTNGAQIYQDKQLQPWGVTPGASQACFLK